MVARIKGGPVVGEVEVSGLRGGAGVDAVGVLERDGADGKLVDRGVSAGRDDVTPAESFWPRKTGNVCPLRSSGIDFGIELLAQMGGERLDHVGGLTPPLGMWMRANWTRSPSGVETLRLAIWRKLGKPECFRTGLRTGV
jgi:hypothetical protein